jgi:hypothetical protein
VYRIQLPLKHGLNYLFETKYLNYNYLIQTTTNNYFPLLKVPIWEIVESFPTKEDWLVPRTGVLRAIRPWHPLLVGELVTSLVLYGEAMSSHDGNHFSTTNMGGVSNDKDDELNHPMGSARHKLDALVSRVGGARHELESSKQNQRAAWADQEAMGWGGTTVQERHRGTQDGPARQQGKQARQGRQWLNHLWLKTYEPSDAIPAMIWTQRHEPYKT